MQWPKADNFNEILQKKSIAGKICDREMLIGSLSTTLLQIFCKIIMNFKIIVKSMKDPDDKSGGTLKH